MPSHLIAAAVVLALGAAIVVVPWLAEDDRQLAGTPVPEALSGREGLVRLPPGASVCLDSVAVPPNTSAVRMKVGTYFRRGQPVTVSLDAPGYRAAGRSPGGFGDNSYVDVPVAAPEDEVLARACIRNAGDSRIALYGTARAHEAARPAATVGGRAVPDPAFVLLARDQPRIERLPAAVENATRFRPGAEWLGWLVAVATLLAVLAGPPAALWLAARRDE